MYSDIDFNLTSDYVSGIPVKTDIAAVEQSIMNIVMTEKGDKPFDPLFGTVLRRYLFQKMNMSTAIEIQTEIEFALKNYEPRIKVTSVTVTANEDEYRYDVSVDYQYLTIGQVYTFEFYLRLV